MCGHSPSIVGSFPTSSCGSLAAGVSGRAVGADQGRVLATRPAIVCALGVTLAWPSAGAASQLIDRGASTVRLEVNGRGQALLTYRARGRLWHVLAWRAVDAVPPSETRRQVAFRLDYSGGWGTYGRGVWRTFRNSCRPYAGPPLPWLVTACTARDGSYWALQSWQRLLPNYGVRPTRSQAGWELRLSHWRGALPVVTIGVDWAYRRYDHLFGTLRYRGLPVYGFRSTPAGGPLDGFGRNVYLDTLDSAYGPGWRRENSFLTHRGSGAFCYGFYPHGARPAGRGARYRVTVIGPGVTPDVTWQGTAPGPYDVALDRQLADAERRLVGSDPLCRPV